MPAATVNYHVHSTERQTFHFDAEGIYGNLISPELAPTRIEVQDLRGKERFVGFADEGCAWRSAGC